MDLIKDCLKSYRDITENMIKAVEEENMSLLEEYLNKREIIIDNMKNLCYDKEELNKIVEELKIVSLQNKLNVCMENKKSSWKNEMQKLQKVKTAQKSYNQNLINKSYFIKEKI